METKALAKDRVLKRAEKREQRRKEKQSVSEAKGLLKMVWKILTGRL